MKVRNGRDIGFEDVVFHIERGELLDHTSSVGLAAIQRRKIKMRHGQWLLTILLVAMSLPSRAGAQSLNGLATPICAPLPATTVGTYTRAVEIDVRPADVAAWERALASLADAVKAVKANQRIDWLVYRASGSKYWIVVSRRELAEIITLESLFSAFNRTPQEASFKAAIASLQAIGFSVTMDTLWQHLYGWSTVRSMSTATHPLAVVTEYSVRSADQAGFDHAMREYVSFLKRIEYPYPVEGFRWCLGRPDRYWSVTFADTWTKYHGAGSLETFVNEKRLGDEFSRLRGRLMRLTQSVKETTLTFARELSP